MQKIYDAAVIFGGHSCENEISVITGTMVCNVLKRGGKEVLPVYVDREGVMHAGEELEDITIYKEGFFKGAAEAAFCDGGLTLFNKRGKPCTRVKAGCVINCCHGGCCEGGAVAGAAKLFRLPLASANMFESAAFMDKYYTKLVLQALGVRTANYAYIRRKQDALAEAAKLGYPLVVKPARLGSSIGVKKADDEAELVKALEVAFTLDGGALLEKYLFPRREINCAAYMAEGEVIVSRCEEVKTKGEVLSYDDKYAGGGERVFPAELSPCGEEEIRSITKRVYAALNMRGIVRIDYIIAEGEVFLCEINTVPGSLSQRLLSQNYKDFFGVLCAVMAQARADYSAERKRKIISTGILNNISSNACKIK